MARKKKEEDYAAELEKSFSHWEDIYENGCSDPTWPDGTNLNLVRNHIFYFKGKIIETMPQEEYPEVFYRPEPPIVDGNYFARVEEIRQTAARSWERFKQDENYQFLLRMDEFIKPEAKTNTRLDALLSRISYLEKAIQRDDLVYMRLRIRFVDDDLSALAECASQVKQLPQQQRRETIQLSLF